MVVDVTSMHAGKTTLYGMIHYAANVCLLPNSTAIWLLFANLSFLRFSMNVQSRLLSFYLPDTENQALSFLNRQINEFSKYKWRSRGKNTINHIFYFLQRNNLKIRYVNQFYTTRAILLFDIKMKYMLLLSIYRSSFNSMHGFFYKISWICKDGKLFYLY